MSTLNVKLNLPNARALVKRLGLDRDGDAQRFHTQNVLRRLGRYMKFNTGTTYRATVLQTDINKPKIVVDQVYAQMLYDGKVRVSRGTDMAGFMTPEGWRSLKNVPKVKSDRDITYTNAPVVGPYWDKRLVANEGDALVADLQRYIDRRETIHV